MRIVLTVLIGLLAAVAFCGFFAVHSVLSYVENPDAVTETAERHELHTLVLEAADRLLDEELAQVPRLRSEKLRQYIRNEAHTAFQTILSHDWFYQALGTGYRTILAILHERETHEVIDLRAKKDLLMRELGTIDQKVSARCTEFLDAALCADIERQRYMIEPIRAAVLRSIQQMPDELRMQEVANSAGLHMLRPNSREMKQARKAMGLLSQARYAALGLLLLFLLIIALVNRPVPRMLVAVGVVLTISAGMYMVGSHLADDASRTIFAQAMKERTRQRMGLSQSSLPGIAARGAQDLSSGAAHDALHHHDGWVLGLGLLGLIGVAGGVTMRRRQPPRA